MRGDVWEYCEECRMSEEDHIDACNLCGEAWEGDRCREAEAQDMGVWMVPSVLCPDGSGNWFTRMTPPDRGDA